MTIWRLSSLNPSAPDWDASIYRGEAIVRAESEEEARMCATQRFVILTEVKYGEKVRGCSWTHPDIVSWEQLMASKYDVYGEPKVLEPTGVTKHGV